jgi:flagellar biosynthetic protein FliQ
MTPVELLDLGRDAIFVLVTTVGPLLAVSLGVGLIIALFQALTQIQEMTLTFVPKIVATFIALLAFLPYMSGNLKGFMERIAERIATM